MNANNLFLKRCSLLLLAAGMSQLGACALVSRGETMQVRYFTLDNRDKRDNRDAKPEPHAPAGSYELRLGRIEASGGINEQIAVRKNVHEISYRDDQRWTEKPAQFVRRELERALFSERGLRRSYSGVTPSLEVELTELELVEGDQSQARVRLTAQLRDERRSLCQDNFETQLPIGASASHAARDEAGSADMERSVSALADALYKTVEQVAARTVQCLSASERAAERPARPAARAAAESKPAPEAEAPAAIADAQ